MTTRVTTFLSIAALLSGAAFAQSTEAAPKFEVADIHPSLPTLRPNMQGPYVHGGRYELRTATMVDLIRTAYGIDSDKVFGGPNWLEFDRFDVAAKLPAGARSEDLKPMLQDLLKERFHLVTHPDTKEFPSYILTAGPSPKLKQSEGADGPGGCSMRLQNSLTPQPGVPMSPTVISTCKATSMEQFTNSIRGMVMNAISVNGGGQNTQIVDKTNLKGLWDLELKFSLPLNSGAPVDISVFDAVDKQLGLKLESVKIPLPVVSVDSVSRKPTENSPDAAKSLPVPPTEFDVAEIKPSTSGNNVQMAMVNGQQMAVRVAAGGRGAIVAPFQNDRVNLTGYSLKNLINLAWNISGEEYLSGAPKWMESDKWDLIAKAPHSVVGLPSTPDVRVPIDTDVYRPMIRNLLIEKFKLAVHYEDRPVTAWVLTAAKPKMQKADPANRTKWMNGPGPDGKDPRKTNPALQRLIYLQNMTMAEFAAVLSVISGGDVNSLVEDKTGLEGAYDFTLSFSPNNARMIMGGRGGDGGAGGDASDPSGGMSIFDAVAKQLGLKLEQVKRPTPVLVIDHAEQKPTEN